MYIVHVRGSSVMTGPGRAWVTRGRPHLDISHLTHDVIQDLQATWTKHSNNITLLSLLFLFIIVCLCHTPPPPHGVGGTASLSVGTKTKLQTSDSVLPQPSLTILVGLQPSVFDAPMDNLLLFMLLLCYTPIFQLP